MSRYRDSTESDRAPYHRGGRLGLNLRQRLAAWRRTGGRDADVRSTPADTAPVADAFDRPTPGYGTGDDFHARLARSLVSHAGLRPGDVVLDVATGTAPVAIAAAEAVGPGGHVVGVDIAAGMLAQARRNIPAERSAAISLLRMDGSRLPFPDACFDAVLCSSSLVWFPDISAALREWARVTRPGGRLAFSCLAASALPLGTLLRRHLAGFGVAFPDLNEPLDTPEKCRRAVDEAGYTPIEIHAGRYDAVVPAGMDAWAVVGALLAPAPAGSAAWETLQPQPVSLWARVRAGHPIPVPLSEAQLDRLRRDYLAEVAALSTSHGIPNPHITMVVVAQRREG